MTTGPDSRQGIETELRESRAWIACQKEAFQAALGGAPLEAALDILIHAAIEQLGGQVRCAFYLVDRSGKELHHITGMSRSYAACVEGFKVGPDSVACGLAVHREQPVITADVTLDPQWEPWLWMAKEHGYRACWSFPVGTSARNVLGTLAMYFPEPREATARDLELAFVLTRAASIIVSRHREAEERARVETERAQVLAREQEARREAERLMLLRDEFLAVISHELRTPLSAILLWSRMLSTGAVPPEQQSKAFASIESSASAQKKLVEDLLDVSAMLSGQMQLSLHAGEVRPVIEAAVATVRPMALARGVTLSLDLGAVPSVARIDPERLQQVIWNLLTNAVKFTPAGGTVSVRLTSLPAVVRVMVEDTGQGIAAGFLPHVFERFRQQDASRTRVHGGLGLGLAIVRQLVELHGGTIAAASAGEGRGATFTVELPRLAHEMAIDAPLAGAVDGSASVASYESDRVLDGGRVLLVEDDVPTRHVLRWLLEQHGAQVTAVATTDEALAAIDGSARFDVLVSDIGLPGKDGYVLLSELRQRPSGARLSALALTAYARPDDCRRVMAAGFDAYLAKPVAPRPLVEAVALLSRGMTPSSETR